MVKVKISTTDIGEIVSFEIKGHSLYADHGQDIVCSGISAVAQTAVLGLNHFIGKSSELKIDKGYLYCSLPEVLTLEERERANIVLKTMVLGFEMIALSYPQNLEVAWKVAD
jgi:uncharacterized protein YsxB (DUF464 family)